MPNGSKVALRTNARREGDIGDLTGTDTIKSPVIVFASDFGRRIIRSEISPVEPPMGDSPDSRHRETLALPYEEVTIFRPSDTIQGRTRRPDHQGWRQRVHMR
jgi:hypothetical protein